MERILDVSQQPPYVEVYSHAPLMCATLANTRQALAPLAPEDAVFWCHEVHSIMDDITFNLGLYKVKVLSNDGHTCLYSISPDMPPQQQADVMLHAAKQLRQALSKVRVGVCACTRWRALVAEELLVPGARANCSLCCSFALCTALCQQPCDAHNRFRS